MHILCLYHLITESNIWNCKLHPQTLLNISCFTNHFTYMIWKNPTSFVLGQIFHRVKNGIRTVGTTCPELASGMLGESRVEPTFHLETPSRATVTSPVHSGSEQKVTSDHCGESLDWIMKGPGGLPLDTTKGMTSGQLSSNPTTCQLNTKNNHKQKTSPTKL